jgi:hypothetical protein
MLAAVDRLFGGSEFPPRCFGPNHSEPLLVLFIVKSINSRRITLSLIQISLFFIMIPSDESILISLVNMEKKFSTGAFRLAIQFFGINIHHSLLDAVRCANVSP